MSEIMDRINSYPEISFIDDYTLDQMMGDMVKDFQDKYKELTGKELELARADPNRLILYAAALQIYQGFQNVDKGAKMSFLKYSYGDFLENLAALKGLTRSMGSCALTTLRFILSEPRPSVVTIPMGTRVTNGAQIFFYTTSAAEIPIGDTSVEVPARCVETGTAANDIEIGEIKTMVDTIGYISGVENVTKTQGGADMEDDESLKERIYLKPQSYSVAGPTGSYIYHAKTFSSTIADVRVTSPVPGTVNVRILLDGGELPGISMCEALKEYLSEDDKRPLTDNVIVEAPETIEYDVILTYFIGKSSMANEETIKASVEQSVNEYNIWQQTSIGRDINPDVLTQKAVAAGAKRLVIESPVFMVVTPISVAHLRDIEMVYGGIEDD